MPPQRNKKRAPKAEGSQPIGMPIYDPPALRIVGERGVFVETVEDTELIRQACDDVRAIPWETLGLRSLDPIISKGIERPFLAYHCHHVLPITLQSREQADYHATYMQEVAAYMSSADFQRSEASPDISVLQKKVKQLSGEVTSLKNVLSVSHELVQTLPGHVKTKAMQVVASRRPGRSSSPAASVRSGVSGHSERSKASELTADELKATIDTIITTSKNRRNQGTRGKKKKAQRGGGGGGVGGGGEECEDDA